MHQFTFRHSYALPEELRSFISDRWEQLQAAGCSGKLAPAEIRFVGVDSWDPQVRELREIARSLRLDIYFNGELGENWAPFPPPVSALETRIQCPIRRPIEPLLNSLPENPHGRAVRELRELVGLTRTELANAVGVDQSFISRIEMEERDLPQRHRQKFIQAIRQAGNCAAAGQHHPDAAVTVDCPPP